jgi:hypothetical protein
MSALTPALESFLARTDVATPYVVVDLDVVQERYLELAAAIPEATIFYAVKANPARPLIERLVSTGSSFDVASPAEIDRYLEAGAAPEDVSYGNTIKMRRPTVPHVRVSERLAARPPRQWRHQPAHRHRPQLLDQKPVHANLCTTSANAAAG